MRNDKGQFTKGHKIFEGNPFKIGNTIGPRFEKGYSPWNKGKKTGGLTKEARLKVSALMKGRKMSEAQKKKLRKPKLGGALRKWHGSVRDYKAIHAWVYRKAGKPCRCQFCGFVSMEARKLHWANKTGKYLRKLSDWLRLCVRCHRAYDRL